MTIKKPRKISFDRINFIPSSHEKPEDPGVWKKVLATVSDGPNGKIQMINWARMARDRSFAGHYHEDMTEIFIIVSGKAEIIIDDDKFELQKGDLVWIPTGSVHQMTNTGNQDLEYIAIGISQAGRGRTVLAFPFQKKPGGFAAGA